MFALRWRYARITGNAHLLRELRFFDTQNIRFIIWNYLHS